MPDTEVLHESPCDMCEQVDADPKHRFYNPAVGDTARHMDCCASVGCPLCATQLSAADGAKGADLRTHLTKES